MEKLVLLHGFHLGFQNSSRTNKVIKFQIPVHKCNVT
jgi:hypothetical protein